MRHVSVVATVVLQMACGAGRAAELKPGDAAPEFSLPGSDGQTHTLSEHKAKRAVVLAWFPKAFTSG